VSDIRVLSDTVNNFVVLVAGRKFPGLVVQGDRLHHWLRMAQAGDVESVELLEYEIQLAAAEFDRVSEQEGFSVP
jgi:hypothetical protein